MSEGNQPLMIEVFVGTHAGAWRLYVSRASWCPPELQAKLDDRREAVVAREPNLGELDRYMWASDCPYQKRDVTPGAFDLSATGRSAIQLAAWLGKILGS